MILPRYMHLTKFEKGPVGFVTAHLHIDWWGVPLLVVGALMMRLVVMPFDRSVCKHWRPYWAVRKT